MNLLRCLALLGLIPLLEPRLSSAAEPQEATNSGRIPSAQVASLLSQFQIKKGFRIELVAENPMVSSPVAMAFDESGRLFVAEMRDYPDRREQNPHLGRIRLLEDTDGDGVFDASTVYADNLPWPSAVACYDGGIFVAATPDILYFKDVNGDGIAEVRKIVFSGFGSGANTLNAQALVNNFNWGLDNRIHGGTAGVGGIVAALSAPGVSTVSLDRSDFSFDPRALTISPEAGPTQSGLSFDNHGRRLISDFARPLRLPMFEPRYTARNPFCPKPAEMIEVISSSAPIFWFPWAEAARPGNVRPAPRNEPGRLLPQAGLLVPTAMTNARGTVVYRGSAFPSSYVDSVFIADPSAHLIHRAVLRENGLELAAVRSPDEQNSEFLVSRDPSFRPMQLVNGPEGALYIADLASGGESGRIYRIVPANFRQPKAPQLGKAKGYDLVATLAHTNGWHRDTAARLLCERRDAATVLLLSNMLSNSRMPLARLHALGALDGSAALNETHVLKGLRDPDEHVRERAVWLSEKLVKNGAIPDALWGQLRGLAGDPSTRVRYQLAFTLGEIHRPDRTAALAEIARRNPENRWLQMAALTSLADGAGEMLVSLAADERFWNEPTGQEFLRQLAITAGVEGKAEEVTPVLDYIDRSRPPSEQAFALLYGLGEGLRRSGSSLAQMDPAGRMLQIYGRAHDSALNGTLSLGLRLEAVRLLGVTPYAETVSGDLLLALLNSGQTPAMQSALIATLGCYKDPLIPGNLVARWPIMTPVLRNEAVTALLGRNDRIGRVLTALENGKIQNADLSSVQMNFLRTHRDPAISRRALALFGLFNPQRPGLLDQFRPALKMAGDPARGRAIFVARCAACHEPGGEGNALGPDLAAVRAYGKEKILEAILEPNAEVRPGYVTYVAETKAGESWIGILADENSTSVTLRQPNGVKIVLPRTNVQALQAQSWSMMPERLEEELAHQGMADLLAFITATP